MRISRRLIICLLISLVTLTFPAVSNATTEGCPISWQIDLSSKSGIQELFSAKERLGGNMVIDEGTFEFSNFAGELGPMPKPAFNILGLPDLYLYGKTKVAIKYAVQVKDCPGTTIFTIQRGTLLDYYQFTSTPTFIKTTAKEWAQLNEKRFIDFVSAKNFDSCLQSIKSRIIAGAAFIAPGKGYSVPFTSMSFGLLNNNGNFCNTIARGIPGMGAFSALFNLTPDCAWIDSSDHFPRRLGISIADGKTCKFAFGMYLDSYAPTDISYLNIQYQKDNPAPIYIFETFDIAGPSPKPTTINCVKGKLIKKVTAINPKCPSGYIKK